MAARSYPEPHPFEVLHLRDKVAWGKDRRIPTMQEFDDYATERGREDWRGNYGHWREQVEETMASHAKRRTERPVAPAEPVRPEIVAPAPVERPPVNAAPSNPLPALPHLQAKRDRPRLGAMNVKIPEATIAALDRYVRHHGVKKQNVVAEMLAHMLGTFGFPPTVD